MDYIPVLLGLIFLLMLTISRFESRNGHEPQAVWWLVIALVGLLAVFRGFQVINDWSLFLGYGAVVTLNYVVTYWAAYYRYRDPANVDEDRVLEKVKRKLRVHYIIPVYNEAGFIGRCVSSIVTAAAYVQDIAEVTITVVNDASTDDTWKRLQELADFPGVRLMNLQKNAGKKGAITAGTYGGERWREAFVKFEELFQRNPSGSAEDRRILIQLLREVECDVIETDLYLHTDSDSVISESFIRYQVLAFLSNPGLGALSGHCDVYMVKGTEDTMFTRLQVAWYYTQFRVRKAAESAFRAVFCVSGPGAGFRIEAIFHLLPQWVDDYFGGRIYRGATDRMITLLVLQEGWKVEYSALARVWTVVPSTPDEARRQWTRWKQNFWRMLIPVWRFAWKTHPVVAFLTYSRLLITVFAPFLLAYHLTVALLGGLVVSALYLAGIAFMGSLMGLAYLTRNRMWQYAVLRPAMSLTSTLWGSILTLRALFMTLQGGFTWREVKKEVQRTRRWSIYRMMGFEPTFEVHYLEAILVIVIIIYIIRYFWGG